MSIVGSTLYSQDVICTVLRNAKKQEWDQISFIFLLSRKVPKIIKKKPVSLKLLGKYVVNLKIKQSIARNKST